MMPTDLDDIKIAVALTIRTEDDFGAIRGPVGIGIEARDRGEMAWPLGLNSRSPRSGFAQYPQEKECYGEAIPTHTA